MDDPLPATRKLPSYDEQLATMTYGKTHREAADKLTKKINRRQR